jgi:hypothetical protein
MARMLVLVLVCLVVYDGDGASFPDWQWYKFAEWFANGHRMEIRFRHGRVIEKLYESQKD